MLTPTIITDKLWGSVACVLLCYSLHHDCHRRFPWTWFAGSRNVSRLWARPRVPDSELAQNQATRNLPTDWPHGFFYPPRHPTLVFGTRKGVTSVGDGTDVRYGCSRTCRFVWLPFFVRGTSQYFRRSSYQCYVFIWRDYWQVVIPRFPVLMGFWAANLLVG